jgi:type II secretion system protein J
MSRSPSHFRSRHRGFTLIELVLALAAAALLATSLYASMKIAFNAQAAATASVEPSRTADIAMEFVRDDLQNAMPPHDPSTYTSQYQYLAGSFEGQNSGGVSGSDGDLIFFSTSSMKDHPSGNGEIKQIELTTDTLDGKKCLVRKAARNLTVETQPPPADEEVLCRDVDSFTLRFFDGSNWNDVWDSTQMTPNELPVAVEATIVLNRPSPGQHDKKLIRFTRVFQLNTSTAAEDADATSGLSP